MSLRVWLPLNGTLENKGLSDINLNATPTYVTGGKIGNQCLASQLGWFEISDMAGKKQMSFAYWVKINTATSTNWLDTFSWYSTDGTTSHRSRQEFYTNSTQTGVWFQGGSIGTTFRNTVGDWNHYVFTIDYDKGEAKFYINGELTNTSLAVDTTHYIKGTGSAFLLRESALDSHINDFRLYDHILSPLEVKHIAQGLILHYPLSDKSLQTMNNVYIYPRFETSSSSGGWAHWGQTGSSGSYGQSTDAKYRFRNSQTYSHWIENASNATGNYLLYQEQTTGSTVYRSLQCIVKEADSKPITESILYPAWNGRTGGAISNKWTSISSLGNGFYLCKCEDIQQSANTSGNSALVGFYIHPGYRVYFSEAYLENDREMCSDFIWSDSTTIYDCSGFCNNGIKTGTFNLTSDTPKYLVSMIFPSGYNYIDCGASQLILPKDSITINLWVNYSTWGNPISCTEGGGWNFENSSGIQFPLYISGVGYKVANSGISTSTLQNEWHMLTGTFDKINVKIYIDGQLKATTPTGSTNKIGYANNHCYIGAEASGGTSISSASFIGKISDVRIYCTALSAEDIKSLYNNSAYIDNQGNIYGAVYEEV